MKVTKAPVLFAILMLISSFAFSSPISENVEPTPSTISPTLIYPVASKKAFVGSFWGAAREGGRRSHEGIDIFAKKGTPVVAICDGIVVDVRITPKGGKVVWLRSVDHSWTVYYAHLDQQKVKEGQLIKKGELIGTVGNTGNARYTPAHLHFGIYTYNGAVNPYPYVKKSPKIAKPYSSVQPKEPLMVKKSPTQAKKPAVVEPIAKQYIWKTIETPLDTTAKYYVTIQKNVVRVYDGQLQVIGKWANGTDKKYPNQIILSTEDILLVETSGKIVTGDGKIVGSVRS